MFSMICAWINGWENKREAGDLGRHRAHCDVIVMNNSFSVAVQANRELYGEVISNKNALHIDDLVQDCMQYLQYVNNGDTYLLH